MKLPIIYIYIYIYIYPGSEEVAWRGVVNTLTLNITFLLYFLERNVIFKVRVFTTPCQATSSEPVNARLQHLHSLSWLKWIYK